MHRNPVSGYPIFSFLPPHSGSRNRISKDMPLSLSHLLSLYRREFKSRLGTLIIILDRRSLAYANIYHVLSALFRRFDLELVDTIRERDVDIARDQFVSKPTKESRGVCVRVIGEAKK